MKLISILLFTLLATNQSFAVEKTQCTPEVSFHNYDYVIDNGNSLTLELNGVGLRTLDMLLNSVDLFYTALYLENKSQNAGNILVNTEAKRSVLHAVNFLSKEQLIESWDNEFNRLCEDRCEELEAFHEQMLDNVTDIDINDRLYLTHFNDRLEIYDERADGSIGEYEPIMSGEYAKLILKSFIGPSPNSKSLKDGMLGIYNICQEN